MAVVASFKDVAAVSEPVEKRGCHFCVAEDLRPFTEAAKLERSHYSPVTSSSSTICPATKAHL